MKPNVINSLFDRLSKIIKNDQQYPLTRVGHLLVASTASIKDIEQYYEHYPPIIDIVELGAALEYEGSSHHAEVIAQIKYKLQQLSVMLPDII